MTGQTKNVLGAGELPLIISGIRQLTPCIRAYELRDPHNKPLPLISAGSHLHIPVLLADNRIVSRAYSIFSSPSRQDCYEIAVLLEENNQGAAKAIHDVFDVGMQLHCEQPQNHFHLHADASPAIFIAGGIGIAPIKPMAEVLHLRGRRIQLHYAGRSSQEMAFYDVLQSTFKNNFFAYPSDEGKRLDVMHILADAPHNALIYVCGPQTLMDEVYTFASALGISKDRIQSEKFVLENETENTPVVLELMRSNKIIQVAADQSILTAIRDAGINIPFDCCIGDCGTCATKVLEGAIEHRDHVLNDAQKTQGMMCVCVSRAKSEKLILDL